MDVSPISMQMIVPRTNDATQVQHHLNQQTNTEQAFVVAQDRNEVQAKLETVYSRDDAEDGRIGKDPNGRGSGGYQGRRERRERDDEPEERIAVDVIRGNNIDISF